MKYKLPAGLLIGAIIFFMYSKYGKKKCKCSKAQEELKKQPAYMSEKDKEKMARCEERISIKMSMMRFINDEGKEHFRKTKIEECMNKHCN